MRMRKETYRNSFADVTSMRIYDKLYIAKNVNVSVHSIGNDCANNMVLISLLSISD